MWSRAIAILSFCVIVLLTARHATLAESSGPSEYQIKAAFIFNFARFVQWPVKADANPASPMVIGILGENPFKDDLERTINSKSVDGHPLTVRQLHSSDEGTNCQIVFISTSEKNSLPQILDRLKDSSVLTVGEMDRFTEAGGMVNFFLEGAKIRFEINNEAANRAGLKISSKLLALALHQKR
jgi:hypothetical protein